LDQALELGEPGEPATAGRVDWSLPYEAARRAALVDFERRYFQHHLDASRGNVSQAARSTGIGRVYLHRLLRRSGLR